VLEGRVGVQLGDDVLEAGPGELIFKPRRVPHAFWNAGDEPARLLEIISPAGFENYFRELAPLLAATKRDETAIGDVVERYELDIDFGHDPDVGPEARSAPRIVNDPKPTAVQTRVVCAMSGSAHCRAPRASTPRGCFRAPS
jgi:hypothetical protein